MMVLSLKSLVSTVWLSAAHAADSRWHRYIRQVLKNPGNAHCLSRHVIWSQMVRLSSRPDSWKSFPFVAVPSSSCPISPIVPVELYPAEGSD